MFFIKDCNFNFYTIAVMNICFIMGVFIRVVFAAFFSLPILDYSNACNIINAFLMICLIFKLVLLWIDLYGNLALLLFAKFNCFNKGKLVLFLLNFKGFLFIFAFKFFLLFLLYFMICKKYLITYIYIFFFFWLIFFFFLLGLIFFFFKLI